MYHVKLADVGGHVLPAPVTGKETVTIASGDTYSLPLSFQLKATPGRLTGHWESEGKSAHIRGANDDTLVSFTIRDSKNARIESQTHAISGKFDVRMVGVLTPWPLAIVAYCVICADLKVEWTYQPD